MNYLNLFETSKAVAKVTEIQASKAENYARANSKKGLSTKQKHNLLIGIVLAASLIVGVLAEFS